MSPPETLAATAAGFEEAGVTSLWLGEYFQSALVRAAVVAGATTRVTVGTHVLQAFARSPLTTALAAQDLQELAHGRFVLGIGSQVPAANRKWHGVETPAPVAMLEDYVAATRRLLETPGDQRVRFEGTTWTYDVPGFRPRRRQSPPPILLGAAGVRTVRAAAAVADGVLGHLLWTPEHVDRVVRPLVGSEVPVTLARMAAPALVPGADTHAARRLAHYAVTPQYQPLLAGQDVAVDRTELLAALRDGRTESLLELTAELRARFCITEPAELAAQLCAAGNNGVNALLLFVPAGMDGDVSGHEAALCDLVGMAAAGATRLRQRGDGSNG